MTRCPACHSAHPVSPCPCEPANACADRPALAGDLDALTEADRRRLRPLAREMAREHQRGTGDDLTGGVR